MRRLAMAALPLSLVIGGWAQVANGQTSLYQGATGLDQTYVVPNASQGQPGSQGQANANQAGPNSGPYSGTVAAQSGTAGGGYSPITIPSPDGRGVDERPDIAVPNPSISGTPGPLFLRPGATPGQFELFQRPPPEPGEFEKFVSQTLGRPLPRFGASLVLNRGRGFAVAPTTTVPPDYTLNPGDELLIGVTGSVEADLRLVIDSEGRIFVPRIGAINLAGVRYGDLQAALARRFNEQYKQARVSVVIGRLHGLNVYVTGYAVSPGAYTVSSLSTMVDAVLAAGGPAAGGSFRTIQLRRNGRLVTTLDLYDLLLSGDKSRDVALQNDDVLNVAPVGPELAVSGSVNAEAIYEAKTGETLGDLIRYAGGPSSLADDSRVFVARLADLGSVGWQELPAGKAATFPAERGDILRIVARAPISEPLERQAILATVEGEVDRPGRYYLVPGATVGDLLARAGGLTGGAFVFGTELDRESVQRQQQASFDKAIDDLELAAAAAPLSSISTTADLASASALRVQTSLAVIQRLKERKPDGRVIISLAPDAVSLPGGLALESNDRVYIPPRPKTVGVFGAVYRPGSFLFTPPARIADYVRLAGGPQRYADRGDLFVVRANGEVISKRQDRNFAGRYALPGDVVFVPVKTSASGLQRLLEIAALVFQFGVGALALKAIS